jgi:hypothetical protein
MRAEQPAQAPAENERHGADGEADEDEHQDRKVVL